MSKLAVSYLCDKYSDLVHSLTYKALVLSRVTSS